MPHKSQQIMMAAFGQGNSMNANGINTALYIVEGVVEKLITLRGEFVKVSNPDISSDSSGFTFDFFIRGSENNRLGKLSITQCANSDTIRGSFIWGASEVGGTYVPINGTVSDHGASARAELVHEIILGARPHGFLGL